MSLSMLIRGSPLRAVTTSAHKIQDSPQKADACLAQVADHLHKTTLPQIPALPDLADWFEALFTLAHAPACPADLRADMTRAARLAEHLLKGAGTRPLHGDLHHDNVLVTPDGGLRVLDAKGVMGDPAYELANAMRNPNGCDAEIRDPHRQSARHDLFARALDVDPKRFAGWAAAKCALSIAWTAKGQLSESNESDLLRQLLALAEA
jgi:streptomycin 6-kinase